MKPNAEALQIFYGSIPVMVTILIALWSNNQRLAALDKRIDDLRDSMKSDFANLREFIRSEIRRLD